MKRVSKFPSSYLDYFGYVSPSVLMHEASECVTLQSIEEGVPFHRMMAELGATWMLGQVVLEYMRPIGVATEVEVEVTPHEHFGAAVMRRAVMRQDGEVVMRFTGKTLPVYYEARKVVTPEAMAHMWLIPAAPRGENFDWVRLPEKMELVEQYPVRYGDCDMNGHLTAFRYVDLICETVGYWGKELHLLERLQIDYKKECMPGEVIDLYRGEADGILYVSGVHSNGVVAFNASVKLSEEGYPPIKDSIAIHKMNV